jgi:hypothetical protein
MCSSGRIDFGAYSYVFIKRRHYHIKPPERVEAQASPIISNKTAAAYRAGNNEVLWKLERSFRDRRVNTPP